MKALFDFLTRIIIIAFIGITLVTTRPFESDFVDWYVEKNWDKHHTTMGQLVDGVYELIIKERTETKNYIVFSVFEVAGQERYVGVFGHIYGADFLERLR